MILFTVHVYKLHRGGRALYWGPASPQDRSADTAAGRRALFGDKSLKPKLQRHRALEAEVEAQHALSSALVFAPGVIADQGGQCINFKE